MRSRSFREHSTQKCTHPYLSLCRWMKLLRAHSSPAQGWEHWESKPCQDTQLMGTAGSREMQDLSLFRGEHHSGHPPACPSELVVKAAPWNPLLGWKGAALALRNGGWNVFHSHLSWGNFCPIDIFQGKKSGLACAMLSLFKHLNILQKGEWRIKLSLLPREEWWFRDRMVFCWESDSSGDHTQNHESCLLVHCFSRAV